MENRFKVFLLFAVAFVLFSCGKAGKYDEYKKIASNLYEVTCNDYDYNYLFEEGAGNFDYLFGCSAIKEGNFFGRNFDFVAGDAAEIVVRTPRKKGRFASIGMVGGLMWLTDEFMASGPDDDAKKLIPLMLLDGINEKGVAVAVNCVNAADVGGITLSTNPGMPKVPQLAVVRYLLDKASSADDAVEIMKNIDIVNSRDVMGLIATGYEIHFLIADKNKSYVVEFDNTLPDGNKIVAMEGESLMTNFYLHKAKPEKNSYPANSVGVERFRKLADNRMKVKSADDMKKLMRSVRFTNSNRTDGEYDPGEKFDGRYTCFSDHIVLGEGGFNYAGHKVHIPQIIEAMKEDEIKVSDVLRDKEHKNPDGLWVTSHSSVYDLKKKTMSVAVYEHFGNYHDYAL